MKEGGDSVAMYYNKLKRLWDELDVLKPNVIDGEERMMQFLMGLGDEYNAIRNQVLIIDPLPLVAKTYYVEVEVERRRALHNVVVDVTDNDVMQTKAYV
ncbi:hypothetical protein LIER_23273 [Lithospermum erythrorhizon]|uniref:Retrotransposon gag domain-containing protein n=1 Tax=Lithospermum erythrorhizon TaxID=34254 RepID=A0AAV3QY73_LITER